MRTLINNLKIEPNLGIPLGNNFYKIRLAIASKGKGKSGGARVITYMKVEVATIFLTSIYDKSSKTTISEEELEQIFKQLK